MLLDDRSEAEYDFDTPTEAKASPTSAARTGRGVRSARRQIDMERGSGEMVEQGALGDVSTGQWEITNGGEMAGKQGNGAGGARARGRRGRRGQTAKRGPLRGALRAVGRVAMAPLLPVVAAYKVTTFTTRTAYAVAVAPFKLARGVCDGVTGGVRATVGGVRSTTAGVTNAVRAAPGAAARAGKRAGKFAFPPVVIATAVAVGAAKAGEALISHAEQYDGEQKGLTSFGQHLAKGYKGVRDCANAHLPRVSVQAAPPAGSKRKGAAAPAARPLPTLAPLPSCTVAMRVVEGDEAYAAYAAPIVERRYPTTTPEDLPVAIASAASAVQRRYPTMTPEPPVAAAPAYAPRGVGMSDLVVSGMG